ncbi:MAG: hypothetical protein Q7S87_05240 [Agitococcus sp.]|nr:hypothetical protein [Agitococcus sp.]
MTTNNIVEIAGDFAFQNRQACLSASACGCYYCHNIFEPKKIAAYTDSGQTALCPFCGIDSVIPAPHAGFFTEGLLQIIGNKWFGRAVSR